MNRTSLIASVVIATAMAHGQGQGGGRGGSPGRPSSGRWPWRRASSGCHAEAGDSPMPSRYGPAIASQQLRCRTRPSNRRRSIPTIQIFAA